MADSKKSRGDELAERAAQALRELMAATLPEARELPILRGFSRQGAFIVHPENVIVQALTYLDEHERVFVYGNDIVLLKGRASENPPPGFFTLAGGQKTMSGADRFLSNLLICADEGSFFPVPPWLARYILCNDHARLRLPQILHHALRPVFSDDFALCGPGWHVDHGILVQGPEIEPSVVALVDDEAVAVDRLPSHLRTLLRGFAFKDAADLANTIAALLTGVLGNHFTKRPKPMVTIDGNQPGTGKTWLAITLGIVLDGHEPPVIHFTTDEEELQKRTCATLRRGTHSVLLYDNAKMRGGAHISSPMLEANCLAAEVSLRILGVSEILVRPNNFLWVLTMNHTRLSQDLTSRAMPVRLHVDGDPALRETDGPNPLNYAKAHREEILGELFGMVQLWNREGRPNDSAVHRCNEWAAIIGGILSVAGLTDFLTNVDEAAATFSTDLDDVAALAEAVIKLSGPFEELS